MTFVKPPMQTITNILGFTDSLTKHVRGSSCRVGTAHYYRLAGTALVGGAHPALERLVLSGFGHRTT